MAINSVGRTTIQGATTVGGFNPATLFSAGEQGVWYDPSDLSTLFQDSAGTIPVTALEQPVGRMLDKSGRGNHATQSTNTSFRPVVSARVNFLTYTQTFASNWLSPPSATSETLAPDGTSTASKVTLVGGSQTYQNAASGTGLFTGSIYVKKNNKQYVTFQLEGPPFQCIADLDNVNITYTTANTSATITDVGNGWRRITITNTSSDSITYFTIWSASGPTTVGGGGTYYLWGPDLRRSNIGVGLPVYQRVGAAVAGASTTVGNADYDANGFPVYLKFDGSNDFLQVASYTMPLINRMTMVGFAEDAAVANQGCVSVYPATGNDYESTTGYVFTPGDHTTNRFTSVGSTAYSYFVTWTTSPSSIIPASVITEDKQTSIGYLRVNGTQVGSDNFFTQFSANSNGGLLLGARFLASAISGSYLNGRIYGVIIRGVTSTANQITGAENWLNQKTAAY